MGDDTARSQGRVSLNPIVHIDPVGTVLMPLLQFMNTGLPLLAWAKPTPVSPGNFKSLSRGQILVSGAGPLSNVILAVGFTAVLLVALWAGLQSEGPLYFLLERGIVMNIGLAIFNMVPLPPLDGAAVASWGLPRHIANHYDRVMEPYGSWILLLLLFTGILGKIITPLIGLCVALVRSIVF
jgi:Zn-dependent protease